MKFAFCLFKYFPYGGLERDFLRIARACQQRGHIIDVYTMKWEGDRPLGFNITLIPFSGWTNHGRAASFVRHLTRLLKNQSYDAVIGFNRMPNLDVYYAADVCYEQDIRQRKNFLYRLRRRYKVFSRFEHAVFDKDSITKILLISAVEKPYFVRYYHTPADRFHLLSPGIARNEKTLGEREEIRKAVRLAFHLNDQHFLILAVGTDYKRKGLGRSLRAIAALPKAYREKVILFVVGRGKPLRYKCLAMLLGITKNIRFLGTRDDVPALFFAADLLLHPAHQESAGNVLLESLISGVPVITTDVCGFAFHIKQADAGLVVPSPFKQGELNAALKEVFVSGRYDQWKENGLHYGKTQDLYSRMDQAVKIIEQVALSSS